MRNTGKVRAGVSVAVAAFALVATTQAFGAVSPKLTVASSEATNTTAITYEQGATDDTLARITVFAPTSVFAPAAQTSGDPVGTATLSTTGGSLSGSITARTGAETVTYNGASATLSSLWAACLGAPQPGPANTSNYWVIDAGGQTIPMFFSSINQDQPFGDAFLAQINVCFPASLKVTKLALSLVESISTSPGFSVWHVRAIPYSGTTQNAAGGAEAEAQDRLPWEVGLNAKAATGKTAKQKKAAKGKVVVSGKVSQGNRGVAGATVQVLSGKTVVASVKTTSGGNYRATIKTKAKALGARAVVAAKTSSTCVEPKFAPLPCTSSTISGVDVTTSEPVAVRK
jgi:hypothetical protein